MNTRSTRSIEVHGGSTSFSSFPSLELSKGEEDASSISICTKSTTSPPIVGSSTSSAPRNRSIIPPSPRQASANFESSLTINKLSFHSLGLKGRQAQIELLQSKQQAKCRQLVWISGVSGCGKTALVKCLRVQKKSSDHTHTEKNGLFVLGKHDPDHRDEPYSAIFSACSQICAHILSLSASSETVFLEIQKQMEVSLGLESLHMLKQLIPVLEEVLEPSQGSVEKDTQEPVSVNVPGLSSSDAKNRINFAFKSWFHIITKFFSPLTFVLDDLQWADRDSLSLLEVMVGDHDSPPFMFVGIYRSNEVDDSHMLFKTKATLTSVAAAEKERGKLLEITDIEIGNLGLEAVHEIVQNLLSLDNEPARTLGLAELCLRKTNGNILFLLQYMALLQRMELLVFNLGSCTWLWNEREIFLQTEATDNVVTLLQAKMTQCGHHKILPLAACLGSTFSSQHVDLVWNRLSTSTDDSEVDVSEALSSFEEEGFLERINGSYRWVHDRIKEAAASLLPEDEHPSFCRRVGKILLAELDAEEKKTTLFAIAELLNQSSYPEENTDIIEEAKLNLAATQRAIDLSAFSPAAKYSAKGIDLLLLVENHWSDEYALSLELYTLGAQAEGYLGNIKVMERYCDVVLAQKSMPLKDKFCVYNTWVDSMGNRGNVKEAVDILLDILEQCDCRFPKQGSVAVQLQVLWNIVKIRRNLRADWFNTLKPMSCGIHEELMRFLDKLITFMYVLEDDRLPLIIFRMLNWTLMYGYCEYSPIGIGFTGVLMIGGLNDLKNAYICRMLALFLMEKIEFKLTESRNLLIANEFLQPWAIPLRDCIKALLRGYEAGMKSGDTESATWAAYHFSIDRFYTGVSLSILDADLGAYCGQMEDLQRQNQYFSTALLWQLVLNFMGRAKGSYLELDGDAVNAAKYSSLITQKKYSFLLSMYNCKVAVLYCYFGAHARLANLTYGLGYDYGGKVFPGTLHQIIDLFVRGVSCFAAARKENKRKFAKLGWKCLKRLRHYSKNGNPNVQHYLSLVEAEHSAYKGDSERALGFYLTALRVAARSGFPQDAGLTCVSLVHFSS